ncbi:MULTISPECIES: hypothetical protein [Sphingomonas]|uniref:hypothetical protein n=1 Tax=Sphingomonas TaxID=13687 RepID=UPI00254A0A89|nr:MULTISPECIES: hypothetical protein [Sphingomonas]MDK8188403.1 hypothetical protein [Sphingomonas zeae]MDK8217830.1 hypothetical protein [Sphingomonas sp. UMB7805-LC452B]
MSEHSFTTNHMWHNSAGCECECEVEVTYIFHRGCKATLVDPGEPDSVEVLSVVPVIAEYETGDIDLEAFADECMAHYRDMLDDAAERRAEDRREALYLERFA